MTNEIILYVILMAAFAALVVLTILLASNQKKKVIEWLKYAVSMAEKELGEKTGQLKLRQVYDQFIMKFPKISSIVSFDTFSKWVDYALQTLDRWMDSKNAISTYIHNDQIDVSEFDKM